MLSFCMCSLNATTIRSPAWEGLTLGFLTRSDTNHAVQGQRMAIDLPLWIKEIGGIPELIC